MADQPSVLILATTYSELGGPPTMTDELAHALAARGCQVRVLAMQWEQRNYSRDYSINDDAAGLKVLRTSPVAITGFGARSALLSKWILTSWHARRLFRQHFGSFSPDLVYATSPAVARWAGIVGYIKRPTRSYLAVVDFFPYHQHAIGLVPGGVIFRMARWFERRLIDRFDTIGCMSPKNIDYFIAHYSPRPDQRVELAPIVTRLRDDPTVASPEVRRAHGLPDSVKIVLFGGQITEGRGIETILDVAALAATSRSDIMFLFVGAGRLVPLVEDKISRGAANVRYLGSLPRDKYLELAAASDVGLIVTVEGVDVPTFPSKSLDYLHARLPIVAAVEQSTDFGDFVAERGLGVATAADDPAAILNGIVCILDGDPRATYAASAKAALAEVFDVELAVDKVLETSRRDPAC